MHTGILDTTGAQEITSLRFCGGVIAFWNRLPVTVCGQERYFTGVFVYAFLYQSAHHGSLAAFTLMMDSISRV